MGPMQATGTVREERAIDAGPCNPRVPRMRFLPGSWCLRGRRALTLDVFRVLAGLALLGYFLDLYRVAPVLLESHGLYAPEDFPLAAFAVGTPWLGSGLSVEALRAVVALGILGTLGIVLGVTPRLCSAVLFVLSVSMFRALFPITHLDDYVVVSTLFFLVLLPVGKTLCVSRGCLRPQTWRQWPRTRVPALGTNLFLIHVLVLYGNVWLWIRFSPSWPNEPLAIVALSTIPVLRLISHTSARLLAIGVQIALHWFLAWETGMLASNAILLCTAILFWGEPAHESPSDLDNKWKLDAAAAVAGVYLVVLSIYYAATATSFEPAKAGAGGLLAYAGLRPVASGRKLPPQELDVRLGKRGHCDHCGQSASGVHFPLSHMRLQLLLAYLADGRRAVPREALRGFAARVARYHCQQGTRYRERQHMRLLRKGRDAEQTVAAVLCAGPEVLPVVEMTQSSQNTKSTSKDNPSALVAAMPAAQSKREDGDPLENGPDTQANAYRSRADLDRQGRAYQFDTGLDSQQSPYRREAENPMHGSDAH